jgi:hypothetical protein
MKAAIAIVTVIGPIAAIEYATDYLFDWLDGRAVCFSCDLPVLIVAGILISGLALIAFFHKELDRRITEKPRTGLR